jgi:hypothetical protein
MVSVLSTFPGLLVSTKSSVFVRSAIENATIVIGGDMNLPRWDWKENILKPNAVFTNLHNYFMDIINNNALSQLIDQPTRLTNTLDLVLTNRPGKVLRTDVILHIIPFCFII